MDLVKSNLVALQDAASSYLSIHPVQITEGETVIEAILKSDDGRYLVRNEFGKLLALLNMASQMHMPEADDTELYFLLARVLEDPSVARLSAVLQEVYLDRVRPFIQPRLGVSRELILYLKKYPASFKTVGALYPEYKMQSLQETINMIETNST